MDWQQIKSRVDRMLPPNNQQAALSASMTIEGKDKDGHPLSLYKFPVYSEPGVEVEYRWAFCTKCQETMWKKIVAWNNVDGTCYERMI